MSEELRRLHVGGSVRKEGWEVLDARPADHVDHVGDARDLSRFSDATFDELYASHVVEHFDYKDALEAVLREWCRVLRPRGTLHVSVPDLETLCRLFIHPELDVKGRFLVMRMMFGGHVNPYDYHYAGLSFEFLGIFLTKAGFTDVKRVPSLGLFQDTSELKLGGVLISLNVVARKPQE